MQSALSDEALQLYMCRVCTNSMCASTWRCLCPCHKRAVTEATKVEFGVHLAVADAARTNKLGMVLARIHIPGYNPPSTTPDAGPLYGTWISVPDLVTKLKSTLSSVVGLKEADRDELRFFENIPRTRIFGSKLVPPTRQWKLFAHCRIVALYKRNCDKPLSQTYSKWQPVEQHYGRGVHEALNRWPAEE